MSEPIESNIHYINEQIAPKEWHIYLNTSQYGIKPYEKFIVHYKNESLEVPVEQLFNKLKEWFNEIS